MTGYSAALTYYNRNRFPSASLGLTGEYSDRERSMRVDRVEPGDLPPEAASPPRIALSP